MVRQVEFGVVFVCSSLRRCEMLRRGWQTVEVPAGWFEVIRGRRPKSESWPRQSAKVQFVHNKIAAEVVTVSSHRWQREAHPRRGCARVAKLEAAVSAVGESDPIFPVQRGSQTEACPGITSGEPDQVFGVLHRTGEEARGRMHGRRGEACERPRLSPRP